MSTAAWRAAPQKNDFWAWKIIFVKLESGDWWFAGISPFLHCLLLLGRLPWVGEIILWNWRVAIAGICWDFFFCGVRAKNDFWVGKITFLKRLLGFAGISSFTVSTAAWRTARKKMIFGSGKSFFWNWRVAIAGICWDFFFYGVDCCLAGCPEKNDFWVGKIIFLKLETSDCWDLMGFLLLRCLLSKRLVVLAYILRGYRFFFFLIVLGGWGNVVAWSFYMLMTPLFSQPHLNKERPHKSRQ